MFSKLMTGMERILDTGLTAAFMMVSLVLFVPLAAYHRRHLSH